MLKVIIYDCIRSHLKQWLNFKYQKVYKSVQDSYHVPLLTVKLTAGCWDIKQDYESLRV